MRNLLLFAKQNSNIFLFIVLQLICIRWIIASNKTRSVQFKNTSNKISASFLARRNYLANFFKLDKINQKIVQENEALLKKVYQPLAYIPIHDSSYESVKEDSVAKTKKTIRYNYTAAKIVDFQNNQVANFITLNKGANHNIKKGESVISTTGIVGRVVNVSKDYSLVRCIISEKENASAKTKSGKIGFVSWEPFNLDYAILNDMPQSEKIKKGDTIYASSYSIYPEDIMIGFVTSKINNASGTGYSYKLKLATDFRNLHYAYVVHDFLQDDLQQLFDSATVLENEIVQKNLMIQKKIQAKRKLDSLSRVKASIKDTIVLPNQKNK